jgi:hypothetical protein
MQVHHEAETALPLLSEQFGSTLKAAATEAIAKNRALGISIPISQGGKVILVPPDQLLPWETAKTASNQ